MRNTVSVHTGSAATDRLKLRIFGFIKHSIGGILTLSQQSDDKFIRDTLGATILSGTYYEVHINQLLGRTLTLHSDCDISGKGTLKSGTQISDISYKREATAGGKGQIGKIKFKADSGEYEVGENDFSDIVRKCFHTSKTISLTYEPRK